MKVSLNTIKQFIDFELPAVDDLVDRINQRLGGVEEVIDLNVKYKDAKIVRVVECYKHPNADKLSLCKIDDGSGELIQVVCGANNVKADMLAVWLPPESIVPSTYDDAEPFKLGARELRGEMSHGMLASAKELAIGDDHDGIVEITKYDLPSGVDTDNLVGQGFAKVFGLDDTIVDIENKMFTHRPDLFGQLGVAREISGIYHKPFTSPEWYRALPEFNQADGLDLTVFNHAGEAVPRFMAVAISDIEIKQSPLWFKCELVRLGGKPINNIVDITNYVMLMTAQPVHAYDYDKLRGGTLGVRLAEEGESLTLLNHKKYQLDPTDIVIVDGKGPVGLAGVMGGGESEVSEGTKNIVLEIATFDMYTVRKTSMRYGLFTDAVTRFNKGQSPLQTPYVLGLLMNLVSNQAGGRQASQVWDGDGEIEGVDSVVVTSQFINDRLGLELSPAEMKQLLENVEMRVEEGGSMQSDVAEKDHLAMTFFPPFWRRDIDSDTPEDIVEEVGRLYGFDKLPRELPQRSIKPVNENISRITKQRIRESLSRAGANEVLTYSFVHENTIRRAEQDPGEAFKLSNALSPDLQYYRLSVLPSLLDKVHTNIKSGYDEFVLFEIGKGHNKKYHAADDRDDLPSELNFVDLIYANKKPIKGAPFYQIRHYVEQLMHDFGRDIVCLPITEDYQYPVTAPFDLSRSAMVHDAETNEFIGMIGELKASVLRAFKLPDSLSAATLDFAAIEKFAAQPQTTYRPLSRYPSVTQDVSLELASKDHYVDLYDLAQKTLQQSLNDDYSWSLTPIAIYQGDDKSVRVMTLRLVVESYVSTLKDQDVQKFIADIVEAASDVYGAKQK